MGARAETLVELILFNVHWSTFPTVDSHMHPSLPLLAPSLYLDIPIHSRDAEENGTRYVLGSTLFVKEVGHFLHVQNHDLLKFIIRQWYTFNKNFE